MMKMQEGPGKRKIDKRGMKKVLRKPMKYRIGTWN